MTLAAMERSAPSAPARAPRESTALALLSLELLAAALNALVPSALRAPR